MASQSGVSVAPAESTPDPDPVGPHLLGEHPGEPSTPYLEAV